MSQKPMLSPRLVLKLKVLRADYFPSPILGWCQDNGNGSNQESKFDFLATHQCLVKNGVGQQKIKIIHTNQQSNLRSSCQSICSLCQHYPSPIPLDNFKGKAQAFKMPYNM